MLTGGADRRQARRRRPARAAAAPRASPLVIAAVAAGAGHLRRVDALLRQHLGCRRHGDAAGAAGQAPRCGTASRPRWQWRSRRLPRSRRAGAGWRAGGRRRGAGLGLGVEHGDDLAGDDGCAVGLADLGDDAGRSAPAVPARPCRSRCRSGSRRGPTVSPTFLCHCNRVASATDSDSCGTFTSIEAICWKTPEFLVQFVGRR